MAKSIMTLDGVSGPSALGSDRCKCVYNPRTKRHAQLCHVGKSAKNRSGWQFTKGGASRCARK